MKRTAFFISDGTGLTAEALGHALLAQFEKIEFERVTVPYIDDEEKARDLVSRINKASEIDGEPVVCKRAKARKKFRQRSHGQQCTGD